MSIYSMRMSTRAYFARYPGMFYALYTWKPRIRALAVNRNTKLVIEGFPRSGNTFAVTAFQHVQREPVNVAHHLHAPAQVIQAARHDIPALVLIRRPVEATVSLLLRRPELPVPMVLAWYESFYNTLLPFKSGFVAATFDSTTHRLDQFVAEINRRFQCDFSLPMLSAEDRREVFRQIDAMNEVADGGRMTHTARPSIERNAMKRKVHGRIQDPRFRSMVEQAEASYEQFISETLAV